MKESDYELELERARELALDRARETAQAVERVLVEAALSAPSASGVHGAQLRAMLRFVLAGGANGEALGSSAKQELLKRV